MNAKEFTEVKSLLATPKNIVIVPHKNPDGDAVGSCLAMAHFLLQKKHKITIVTPNDYPEFLKWLPKAGNEFRFDYQNKQSVRAINQADIIFTLDFNALHRVGEDMEKTLEKFTGIFIMIDHHQQPDNYAKYTFSNPDICSTCQMVYHFLENLNETKSITPTIATCLYTGIMTDTGSFKFASTTSVTHKIVANLINKGANNFAIHSNVYDTNSYNRIQLLGRALSNMVVLPEYKTAYITLSQNDLNEFNYQKGDTEGVVNYALSVKGIVFAVIFIEDVEQKIIKISFRSKGKFSVNQFARKYFNGGGHDNASGGRTEISLEKTVENFLQILPNYKTELEKSYES